MKAISVHVLEEDYRLFKSRAAAEKRPVAELIREAMRDYLDRLGRSGDSVLDIEPYPSGKMLEGWERSELYDEMFEG